TFGLDLVGHPIENEDEIQPPGAYFLYNKNPKNLSLRNDIEQSIEKLREEGTLAEISEQHSGQDDTELTKEIIEKKETMNQEVLSQMAETESVRQVFVGNAGAKKTMNYFDDKKNLEGIEIDIHQQLDHRLDQIDITYVITELACLVAGLDLGKFDLVAKNLGEHEERREKFLLSL